MEHFAELERKFSQHHDIVLDVKQRLDRMEVAFNRIPAAPGTGKGFGGTLSEDMERKSLVEFAKGMSVSTDSEGGYTVTPELERQILLLQRNRSPMRRLARVTTIGGAEYQIPRNAGGTASGWVGETEDRPETDASQIGLLSYPAHEIYAMPSVTQKLLDDSAVDIASFIQGEIAAAFEDKEADAWINGDGVGKPQGFLSSTIAKVSTDDATRDFGKLQYIATGNASSFDSTNPADVFITTVFKLKAGHRQNARWLMNSATAAAVSKIKDGENRYIWNQSLASGTPNTLLGYPVEFDEGMPDIGAGEFPIAFGDWQSGYQIVDRVGIRMLLDPYTLKGSVRFYSTKRCGGGLKDSNAIKLIKIATS